MMRLSAQAVKTKELKCVDHAREVGRRYRRIDKIVDQLILHRLTHIGGKQFVRVLIHQKQNLTDPAELLYSIAKLEPLAQLPDGLPDDLHHQHIGTAGPAQGKRFLRF